MSLLPYFGLLVAAIILGIGALALAQRHFRRKRREEQERRDMRL